MENRTAVAAETNNNKIQSKSSQYDSGHQVESILIWDIRFNCNIYVLTIPFPYKYNIIFGRDFA